MSDNSNNSGKSISVSVGGGFCGLLTIAFIVLKLCGVIDWAWIWVLAPLWIAVAFGLLVAIIGAIIVGVVAFKNR